tara:strand:+ start:9557 stop:10663 length:1107 start_codon:yes stop_codon:yes gene_type:complete
MRINIARPEISDEEIEAVCSVLKSGMIASGPETLAFESEFAEFVGCDFACAVNNGTSALSLALSALGIGPGDEVITTPLTFVATANAILSCGATPVFADIDSDTYNLSPQSTIASITERTRAIMPVHLYGLPSEMTLFREISEENGISLVGDAAQAHGAAIGNQKVGSLADIECFSFYPTKNMTTAEGGMVTTKNKDLYDKMNSIRNHGRPDSKLGFYEHDRFGLNLRLTDIGSSIGRVQLKKLPRLNSRRKENAKLLSELLEEVGDSIILPIEPKGFTHAWHQYTVRVSDRTKLAEFLKERGIGCGIYYPRLIYEYPHLQKFKTVCENAERVVSDVISLPVHPGLKREDIEEIAQGVIDWSDLGKKI